jgi:hypothetical protein
MQRNLHIRRRGHVFGWMRQGKDGLRKSQFGCRMSAESFQAVKGFQAVAAESIALETFPDS